METNLIKKNVQQIDLELMKLMNWLERHYEVYSVEKQTKPSGDNLGIIVEYIVGSELRETILNLPIKEVYFYDQKRYNGVVRKRFEELVARLAIESYNYLEEKLNEIQQFR